MKIEYENTQLHTCLDDRNHFIVKLEEKYEALEKEMSSLRAQLQSAELQLALPAPPQPPVPPPSFSIGTNTDPELKTTSTSTSTSDLNSLEERIKSHYKTKFESKLAHLASAQQTELHRQLSQAKLEYENASLQKQKEFDGWKEEISRQISIQQSEFNALKSSYETAQKIMQEEYETQLRTQKQQYETTINNLNAQYKDEIASQLINIESMKHQYETNLVSSLAQKQTEIDEVELRYVRQLAQQMDEMRTQYEKQVAELRSGYESQLLSSQQQLDEVSRSLDEQIAQMNQQIQRRDALIHQNDSLSHATFQTMITKLNTVLAGHHEQESLHRAAIDEWIHKYHALRSSTAENMREYFAMKRMICRGIWKRRREIKCKMLGTEMEEDDDDDLTLKFKLPSPSSASSSAAASSPFSSLSTLLSHALLFHSWHSAAVTHQLDAASSATSLSQTRNKSLQRAFNKIIRSMLSHAFHTWYNRIVATKFHTVYAHLHHQKQERVRLLLDRWRTSGITRCFSNWKQFTANKRAHRRGLLEKILRRFVQHALFRALRLWYNQMQSIKTHAIQSQLSDIKARHVRKLIEKWRLMNQTPYFLAWRSFVRGAKQHKRTVLDKILKRLAHLQLYSAFHQWTKFVDGLKLSHIQLQLNHQKQQRVAILLSTKWRLSSTVAYFNGWMRYARERKQQKRAILGRICARIQQLSLYRGWRVWRLAVENAQKNDLRARLMQEKYKRCKAMIDKWRRVHLAPFFVGWKSYVRQFRAHKQALLTKVLKRMENFQLYQAFKSWHSGVEGMKLQHMQEQLQTHRTKRIKALVDRWRLNGITPFFLNWRSFVRTRKARKAELLTKVLNRLSNLQLYQALRTWKHQTDTAQLAQLRAQLLSHKASRIKLLISKWRSHTIVPVFKAWKAQAKAQRERRTELLTKILGRMQRINEHRALRQWRTVVESSKQQEFTDNLKNNLSQQKAKRVKHLVQTWRLNSVTPVFHAWRSYTRRTRERKRMLLDKYLRRLAQQSTYAAWRRWLQSIETSKLNHFQSRLNTERHKRIESVMHLWANRALVAVFKGWKDYARSNRARKRLLLDQALKRLSNQLLYAGWRTWKLYVDSSRLRDFASNTNTIRERKLQSIIAKWGRRSVGSNFRAWARYAKQVRQRKRLLLDQALRRLSNQLLYRGWRSWQNFISTTKTQQFTARLNSEKQKRAEAIITRWRLSSVTPVFLAWKSFVRSSRDRKRELLTKALQRLARSEVYAAFRTWTQSVEQMRIAELQRSLSARKKQNILSVMDKWSQRSTLKIFLGWRAWSRARRTYKYNLLDKYLARLAKQKLWHGWNTWKKQDEAVKLQQMKQSLEEHYSSSLSQSILHAQKRKFDLMLKKYRSRSKKEVFRAWRLVAHAAHSRKRVLLKKYLDRFAQLKVYQCWRNWNQFVERTRIVEVQNHMRDQLNQVKLRQIQTRVQAWRQRSLIPLFQSWRSYARTRRERKRELLDKCLRRLAQSSLYKAWKQWNQFVLHQAMFVLRTRMQLDSDSLSNALAQEKFKRAQALIARWRVQGVMHAFVAWKKLVADRKERQKALLTRILHRFTAHRDLVRAWRNWIEFLHSNRLRSLQRTFDETNVGGLKLQLQYQKSQRLKLLVGKWMHNTVAPVFITWKNYARDRRSSKRALLDRTLKRMSKRELYLAFRHWKRFVLEHLRMVALRSALNNEKSKRIATLIEYWSRINVTPVFRSWLGYTRAQKQMRSQISERQRLTLDHVVAKYELLSKIAAFRHWQSKMESMKMAALHSVFLQLRQQRLTVFKRLIQVQRVTNPEMAVFQRWKCQSKLGHLNRFHILKQRGVLLNHCVTRLKQNKLIKCWHAWKEYITEARTQEELAARENYETNYRLMKDENETLRAQLREQLEINAYLQKVIQQSV